MSAFLSHLINYSLFQLALELAGLLAFGAIFLVTRRRSRLRTWAFATPSQIDAVSLAVIFLIWLGFVIYNRATGS